MPRPSFSVVIPNFNHTRFLEGAIESALGQTVRPDEIIVVDDGSTDGCDLVVSRFGEPVRYLRQENQGLAAARNTGLRAATGELVGLLDADDRWRATFCEAMLGVAAGDPAAAAYYCRAQTVDEGGVPLPQVLGRGPRAADAVYPQLLRANFIIPSTVVLRRSVVTSAGLFDTDLRSCEDWDLWLRLLPAHRIVAHSAVLVDYRVHGGSLSGDPDAMQYWARRVMEQRFGREDGSPDGWPSDKRRGFGGLYRYCAISTVQRRLDWARAAGHLRQALRIDPTLVDDVDLFYELALAGQPMGYRGVAPAAVADHVESFIRTMELVFDQAPAGVDGARGLATAYKALGLVAYNAGDYGVSRRYLALAVARDARLWRDALVIGDLAKSVVRGWLTPPSSVRPGRPTA